MPLGFRPWRDLLARRLNEIEVPATPERIVLMDGASQAIDLVCRYLIEPGDWNERVARALAQEEHIVLNDDHWDCVRFMRGYYEEHQFAADARFVIKHLGERFGREAQKKLFELFPYANVKQACKIAGMRRPRAWSTG